MNNMPSFRLATLSDLPQLLELEEQWDAPFLRSSEATLRQRLELHPSGQFVAFDGDGTLLAAMYTQRVASLEVMKHGPSIPAHSSGYAVTHHTSRRPSLDQARPLGPKKESLVPMPYEGFSLAQIADVY